jgi:hypothetical protein
MVVLGMELPVGVAGVVDSGRAMRVPAVSVMVALELEFR